MIDAETGREPSRDPRLAEALRQAEPDVSDEAVDWSSMRAAITSRAELPLARLAGAADNLERPRRRGIRRPVLALAPLAAAAGVAALLWVGGPASRDDAGVAEPDAVGLTTLEQAFGQDISEQEFRMIVSGRANPEALLLVAAGEG